jgi:class 3 adenylate cyclase/predicted ATPase
VPDFSLAFPLGAARVQGTDGVIYVFENYALDTDLRELRRGTDLVAVEPQVFDLLLFLIRNRARVVSKDDLIAEVWNGRIVSESTLSSRITAVRQAIGDSGEQQRLIRTVARKGHRFIGQVQEEQYQDKANAEKAAAQGDELAGSAPSTRPERRQLTVMACNVADSMGLSARLDPEDLREMMSAYHDCVRNVVEHHGGSLAECTADGAVAHFGYPQAREEDAERAVRAALAVSGAVGKLRFKELALTLEARVGIATGLVVVDKRSNGSTGEPAAVGETPLLAARLAHLASPGAVVISGGTRRLLGGLFDYRDLGAAELQGIAEPVEACQVLSESGVASRFEALRSRRTRLIGREEEVDLLTRRWQQARQGEGRVVLVTGEPGIGKSRLVYAVQERLGSKPQASLACFCSPHNRDTALHPFSAQLLRAANIERSDSAEMRLEKLEALLTPSTDNLTRDLPLFAALLSIPGGQRYPPPKLTPQQARECTLAAVLRRLERMCAAGPVLMVFEDLQWIDPTSLEALCRIIEQAAGLPLLLVTTARPEFTPSWPNERHTSTMALTRLGRAEIDTLVSAVAQGKTVPPAVVEQIAERTDGVPLFIEELTKTVLESGLLREAGDRYELSGPLPGLAIPSTLYASLLARLDRLASAKEVAHIAAVIGREFSYGLLQAVTGLAEAALQAALARLVAAELIFQRGVPPHATYVFKHALLQDAAYASMLRKRRQQVHAATKRALEARFPELKETQPELLAYHCTEAGFLAEAIDYWERAGRRAAQRFANREATRHFCSALELLGQMSEGLDRDGHELTLLIALGPALLATRPSVDPEVAATYTRAGELARRTSRSGELFPGLWGAHLVAVVGGDNATAARLVDELFALARNLRQPEFLLQAHHAAFGVTRTVGELMKAQKHAEAAVELYRPDRHGRHALVYGAHDPGACSRMNLALLLLLRGAPDRSQVQAGQGLALARSLQHPQTLLQTIRMAAELHSLRREPRPAAGLAAELLALSAQHGSAVGRANGTLLRGWVRIMQGEQADGLKDVQDGLRLWRETGSKLHVPQRLACVAEYFIAAGRPEMAWPLVDEAFAAAERFGERFLEPELHRLKGDLLLALHEGRQDDAAVCLNQALTIARKQDARLLELRAAASFARLRRRQARQRDAKALLAPVYGSFTEGFGLPDLQEAKALLEVLGE